MKPMQEVTLDVEKISINNDSIAGPLPDSTHYQSKSLFGEIKFYRVTFAATVFLVITMMMFYFSLL